MNTDNYTVYNIKLRSLGEQKLHKFLNTIIQVHRYKIAQQIGPLKLGGNKLD